MHCLLFRDKDIGFLMPVQIVLMYVSIRSIYDALYQVLLVGKLSCFVC